MTTSIPDVYKRQDLGTSAVKLLLMDEAGQIKNIVSKEYPLFFPHPGWSEQNPEDWYAKFVEGVRELLEGCDRTQVELSLIHILNGSG